MAVITLLARVLLSLIFILSGLHKVADFGGTVAALAQHGLPATSLLAVLAIAVEVGGGLSVLLGFQARLAAVVLVVVPDPDDGGLPHQLRRAHRRKTRRPSC